MIMAFAGVAASGTAYVRSNAPVRPASPWSLAERMEALRIDRALPPAVRKQATLSLRGPHAVLKVREATGPVLLKCPLRADVPEQYLRFATAGAAAQCEAQAADEVGDVLVYEVSGRVSPLCPGQFATLSQQQLHDALFLPALQLSRRSEDGAPGSVLRPGRLEPCAAGGANCALSKAASALLYCGVVRTCAEGACFQGSGTDVAPDDVATNLYYYQALAQATAPSTVAPAACGPVPMSVHLSTLVSEAVTATSAAKFIETQPWNAPTLGAPASAETAADLRAFFDRHPRGICLFMRGIDVDRAREAEMAAQTLAFPVFAPFDPRLPSRATPLLRSLQRAAFDDEAMGALLGRCEPGAEKACRLKRERVASQLRASVGKLQTPLTNLAADEVPFHIGASGPFHLADSDALHVTLESSAEVPKAKGAHARLMVRYQPLWPESVAEKRLQCLQQPGICLFRALWSLDPPARAADAGEDGFESLVALFGRRDGNTRCVRRLFNALASAGEDRLLELQRDLREPVAAGENRAPCDGRARGLAGLVPRGEEDGHAACADRAAAKPFGGGAGDGCRPVSLVYVQEEPWASPAARSAAPDTLGERAPLGRGRRAAGSRAHLPARFPASRHAGDPRIPGRGGAQPLVLLPPPAGLEHAAMIGALATAALLAAGSEAPDWFRAWQYTAKPATLRGCSDCQGEPDDVCEVLPGAQSRAIAEYALQRSPAADRVKLLRSKADPDCAVRAAAFFSLRSPVELAAIRLARTPPSVALLDRFGVRYSVAGWPRAPQRRKGLQLVAATPDRAALRIGLVCWGAERAWPAVELGAPSACEWWLLPVRADGEPDLARASFPLVAQRDRWPQPFRFGERRWSRAFDRAHLLDESLLLGEDLRAE